MAYQGILFPDRAENLKEEAYRGYKVFLKFWDPLATQLRAYYEGVALRRDTRALVVYGPQGSGKTLLARKLNDDFAETQSTQSVGRPVVPDANNFWHRMTGGTSMSDPEGKLEPDLIQVATYQTSVLLLENDKSWVTTAKSWMKSQQGRRCVVLMDNAERNYFIQGLVDLDDASYLRLAAEPSTASLAGERFVALCRNELRGCLFVMFTNNDLFALSLDEHVNAQHKGLLGLTSLPLPGSDEKETVVRVNTNRLNRISYWYCLDKAGPEEKMAVYTALRGASTFPDSFAAVDQAIKKAAPSRIGRPARKCTLTLMVLSDCHAVPVDEFVGIGVLDREEFHHEWLGAWLYESQWALGVLDDKSGAGLLESEWQLRVVALGRPFAAALLSDEDSSLRACGNLLKVLERIHGPGTWQTTRDATASELRALVDSWPKSKEADAFWSQGQTRSGEYESALSRLFANYNTGAAGFLTYRPDVVIAPFVPCSILGAPTGNIEHINGAIQRNAHVFEFTAIANVSGAAVKAYLALKLPNYVSIVREQ